MSYEPTYGESEVRDAVARAQSLKQALRWLGLRPVGGNYRTLRKLLAFYGISTDHMDPNWSTRERRPPKRIPLREVLVQGSTYSRGKLKRRLYDVGLKARECELCGQGEVWRGQPMSLILDHINGTPDDNRLENHRIVCPNCAATLDTHCGRKNRIEQTPRSCLLCGQRFCAKYAAQRYCSQRCGVHSKGNHDPHPERRKVERPPYEQLMAEIKATSYSAVGRKYGVSDNAVRKWVRWYEARAESEDRLSAEAESDRMAAASAADSSHEVPGPPVEVHEAAEGVSEEPVSRTMATILP